MNLQQLYRDFNIPTAPEHHRHYRKGWTNTVCPYCSGNPGFHLGYKEDDDHFVCWRCGGHKIEYTLMKVLNVPYDSIKALLIQYQASFGGLYIKDKKIISTPFKMPKNEKLNERGRKYLEGRNFDPDKIERVWGVSSTTLFSKQDDINYKNRVLIPIYWDEELVSFLARDVTDKARIRYLVCPASREKVNNKNTLYGNQKAWGDLGIGVEGSFDTWRIGERYGVGLYGIKYTPKQVRLIAKNFKRFPIMFDGTDPAAINKAKQLSKELQFRNLESWVVNIGDKDPAEMKEDEAKAWVKELRTYKIK